MMCVGGSQCNLEHKAFEIYLSGCKQACPGCHNPELHAFGQGQRWERWFKNHGYKLTDCAGLYDKIWILGGEPLDQDMAELTEFIYTLRRTCPGIALWLWTSKSLTEVPSRLLRAFSYVKTGPYRQELASHAVTYDPAAPPLLLASSNQQLEKGGKNA